MKSLKIQIQGKIQGVGFRPFVCNLAHSFNLSGYVKNNALGVEVLIQGNQCAEFLHQLPLQAPEISQIHNIQVIEVEHECCEKFCIKESEGASTNLIPPLPDLGICKACKTDLMDCKNFRYFYPLINCTHCGPRFSVIKSLPYDREHTTMAEFKKCAICKREYDDCTSRFFHAQPISCPECSPKMYWCNEIIKDYSSTFKTIAQKIKEGELVLIEGIGGFHIVCDGNNPNAIQKLRRLKNRPSKPLALMCRDIEHAKEIAFISHFEEELLCSIQAPIVLLKAKKYLDGIAPRLNTYGIMLSYTPIYELLFSFLDSPLVVTSANLKGEPIIFQREQLCKLSFLSVFSLEHQRSIYNPIEDSIVQVIGENDMLVLRNARGYAPLSFRLPNKLKYPLLSLGGNQKANFSLAFEDLLIVSPFIADLDSVESIQRFKESIKKLQKLYGIEHFAKIACDLHPNYHSSKIAKEMAEEMGSEVVYIQHHFAHALSVCYEYDLHGDILGFCFDGTGYGEDGIIWGGEILLFNRKSYKREIHFKPFKLLGGEVAIKDISRIFVSIALDYFSFEEVESLMKNQFSKELKLLYHMHQKSLSSPLTSSVGRLFDMVAYMCGLKSQSYEGESGVVLENLYRKEFEDLRYEFVIHGSEIELDFPSIFIDYQTQSKEKIATKFINTLIEIVFTISMKYEYQIVLCGGVFCNSVLSEKILKRLRKSGRICYIGKKIPPNDNGLSLGQMCYLLEGAEYAK